MNREFIATDTSGGCHFIEAETLLVEENVLTLHSAEGHCVAAFAPGTWKSCRRSGLEGAYDALVS